jgi:hypothetical protein
VLICHCSLAGTMACNECSAFINEYGKDCLYSYSPKELEKKVHRTIKTLEYDDKGRVIKEIIEEE